MRTPLVTAALAAAIALLAPGQAAAATACSHPTSAYAGGTPPGLTNAGGPTSVNDPIAKEQWGLTQIKAPAAMAP